MMVTMLTNNDRNNRRSKMVFMSIFLAFICNVGAIGNVSKPSINVNVTRVKEKDGARKDILYLMNVIFWEQKPFLFTNEKGVLDGIIPQMFEQARERCLNKNQTVNINNYTRNMRKRRDFYELARSNTTYGEGDLKGIQQDNAFWVPVVAYSNRKLDTFLKQRNIRTFQLMKSKEIAVIMRRDFISLPNKIIRGIFSCQQIFFLAILMAILFGLTLWIIERYRNPRFPKSFIKGVGTGLYWSIVSMTTVGYGDITPKNPLGRFIAGIWLFVGVMVGCVMTATMTDIVTGVGDVNVFHKKVSVLELSFEAKTAEKDFGAVIVGAKSYEEVLEMVRKGEVFAGMMNADVAAWYQEEINDDSQQTPLRIVQKLPANLYVNCYLPANIGETMKKIFRCMYFARDEVYTASIEDFQRHCHTYSLYIGSMSDLIYHNAYIQILLGTVCGLVLIGVAYDTFHRYKNSKDEESIDEKQNITKVIFSGGLRDELEYHFQK